MEYKNKVIVNSKGLVSPKPTISAMVDEQMRTVVQVWGIVNGRESERDPEVKAQKHKRNSVKGKVTTKLLPVNTAKKILIRQYHLVGCDEFHPPT